MTTHPMAADLDPAYGGEMGAMTTHDTPEAALALSKTAHDIGQAAGLDIPHDFGLRQEDALVSLGWTLVPEDEAHRAELLTADLSAERERAEAALERVRHEMYLPAHQHPGTDACVGCDLIQRLSGTTLLAAPVPSEPEMVGRYEVPDLPLGMEDL